MKTILRAITLCLFFLLEIFKGFGQPGSLDTTFNSNSRPWPGTDNPVFAACIQPDNKILIGGRFTQVGSSLLNRIARLHPDGTRDSTFNPGAGVNDSVCAVQLQPNGYILACGAFDTANGVRRGGVTRYMHDGSPDTSFHPGTGANNTVRTMALQPDGKILIGGTFTLYDGVAVNRIARLHADGRLDTSFQTGGGANNLIRKLVIQPDNKILVAGEFTAFAGGLKNRITRLNTNGSQDTTFHTGSGTNNSIYELILDGAGKILIAGTFSSYNGMGYSYDMARLHSDGSLDTSLRIGNGITNTVYSMALQPDGKILLAGFFTFINSTPVGNIARMFPNGTLDTAFSNGNGCKRGIDKIVLHPNGSILIAGTFAYGATYNGVDVNFIARIHQNGKLDTSFMSTVGPLGDVNAIAIQPDGKLILGGEFLSYSNLPRSGVVRVHADGSVDTTFNPGSGCGWGGVRAMVLQPDGKIIIGGNFLEYNDTTAHYLARLKSDGSLDSAFLLPWIGGSEIYALALQPDGKILSGDAFGLSRYHADGSKDSAFNATANPNHRVYAIALQPDGKIVIGGSFTMVSGIVREGIARLNPDGTLDTDFDCNGCYSEAVVRTLCLLPDNKVLIGGTFDSSGTFNNGGLYRLKSNGRMDTSFYAGGGADWTVIALMLQPDFKILVGGDFINYDGVLNRGLTRLHPNGSVDTSFRSRGIFLSGYAFALQPDWKVYLGGQYREYDGYVRFHIARLHNDSCLPAIHNQTYAACPGDSIHVLGNTYSATGLYFDRLPFAAWSGCDSLIITNVQIDDVDTTISVMGNTLFAHAANASFQWLDCNNGLVPIPGETASSFSPIANGQYAVIITTENNCTDTSSCRNFTISGTFEGSDQILVSLFPNPTDGDVKLESNKKLGYVKLTVCNSVGQVILEKEYGGFQKTEFRLEMPGLYFLQFTANEITYSTRIVRY